MDDFCQYKLYRTVPPPLFIPPPYARKSECQGERKQVPTLHLRATDPSKLLLLCESLKDQCTLDLEAKINCYLMAEADCDCAFMCSFQVLPKMAVIKMIGAHPIDPDIQLAANEMTIVSIMQNRTGVEFSVDNLPMALLDQLRAIQPDLEGTVNAFPIYEQKHQAGIVEETNVISHGVFIINTTHQKIFLGNLVQECFRFVLPILTNTTAFERQSKIKARMQDLVACGRVFLDHIGDKEKLIEVIIERAKAIFESERCDLYFLDKKLKNLEGSVICKGQIVTECVPKNRGVLGFVCVQNKLLNIANAYDNPLFLKSEDEKCDFHTRNILCFPMEMGDKVVGVVQVRNKLTGEYHVYDENASEQFAALAARAVAHADTLQQMRADAKRQQTGSQLMIYAYDFREAEVEHLLYAMRHKLDGFDAPMFNARTVPRHRIGVCLMKMFEDLGFVQQFQLERRRLAKFFVLVEKGYFNHPYHNYEHAFTVAHFVYSVICYLQLIENKVISGVEAMALILAAVCHNIDHRGISNAYRSTEMSTLGCLYTSDGSIVETHHFVQTILTLNTEDCNFLVNLSKDDYAYCLEMIKHNILATDLVNHLRRAKKQELLLSRSFRPRVMEHRQLFCSLLLTCGDFCDHIHDWRTVRDVAAQMYQEYFHECELQKELSKLPADNLDHDRERVPLLQINFLSDIVVPPYKLLAHMYPDMTFAVDALYDTITNWELSKPHFLNRLVEEVTSLDMLLGGRLSFSNLIPTEEEAVEEEELSAYNE